VKRRTRNPVAKHMEDFCRPVTHVDRKKESKRGKVKHKKAFGPSDYFLAGVRNERSNYYIPGVWS